MPRMASAGLQVSPASAASLQQTGSQAQAPAAWQAMRSSLQSTAAGPTHAAENLPAQASDMLQRPASAPTAAAETLPSRQAHVHAAVQFSEGQATSAQTQQQFLHRAPEASDAASALAQDAASQVRQTSPAQCDVHADEVTPLAVLCTLNTTPVCRH